LAVGLLGSAILRWRAGLGSEYLQRQSADAPGLDTDIRPPGEFQLLAEALLPLALAVV
jgi:hypothetical protein